MKRILRSLLIMTICICMCTLSQVNVFAAAADGTYSINVTLEGGSGRASITSPCQVTVTDGEGIATIEWSSPYYDYMIVDKETYYPVNTDGNSVFQIPVKVYNDELEVTADTTAMSEPHEIDYVLTFDWNNIPKEGGSNMVSSATVVTVLCVACVVGVLILILKK